MDSRITAPSPISSMSQGVCVLVQHVHPYLTCGICDVWQPCDHGQAFRRLESVLLYGFMHIYLSLSVTFFHRSISIFFSDEHYSRTGNAITLCVFLLLFQTEGAQFQSITTSTIAEYQNNIVFQLYFFYIFLFIEVSLRHRVWELKYNKVADS